LNYEHLGRDQQALAIPQTSIIRRGVLFIAILAYSSDIENIGNVLFSFLREARRISFRWIKSIQQAGGWRSPYMPFRYAEENEIANEGIIQ
jgi:hypothetical protein